MRGFLACLIVLLSGSGVWAIDDGDRNAARATIERQIAAFRVNDAATAYAQAAPQIQALFPTADAFLAMVEQGYKPVLRPRSFSFDRVQDTGDDAIAQAVRLQDDEGADWIALYALQRQADGGWRITGCTLRRAPGDRV